MTQWVEQNQLVLNVDKTKRKERGPKYVKSTSPKIILSLNGSEIKQVNRKNF